MEKESDPQLPRDPLSILLRHLAARARPVSRADLLLGVPICLAIAGACFFRLRATLDAGGTAAGWTSVGLDIAVILFLLAAALAIVVGFWRQRASG